MGARAGSGEATVPLLSPEGAKTSVGRRKRKRLPHVPTALYSYLSATIGSTRVARRAGR
jgi:hypothetical protein